MAFYLAFYNNESLNLDLANIQVTGGWYRQTRVAVNTRTEL